MTYYGNFVLNTIVKRIDNGEIVRAKGAVISAVFPANYIAARHWQRFIMVTTGTGSGLYTSIKPDGICLWPVLKTAFKRAYFGRQSNYMSFFFFFFRAVRLFFPELVTRNICNANFTRCRIFHKANSLLSYYINRKQN